MSGSKSFGVRSPPDPPVIHPPYPPPSVEDNTSGLPAPADESATCDCRCPCDGPVQVAPPAAEWPVQVTPPTVKRSVPPQLLLPFPEPPVLRRPIPPGTATRAEPAAACVADPAPGPEVPPPPDAGPTPADAAAAVRDGVQPLPPPTGPGPARLPSCPTPEYRPGVMFQGGEEDDHPYVRVLETPAPERPLLARYLQPISWSAIGFGSAFVFNLFAKKPAFAGIQRHLALGAAGWMSGVYVQKWIDTNSAERDAVMKHYIQLHPEDFPVPERKKYGELLQPWSPLR